jgi:Trk-type K+ transport system membrane component
MLRFLRRFLGPRGLDGDGFFTQSRRERWRHWANVGVLFLGVTAIISVVAEYGFYLKPEWEAYTQTAGVVVLYGFALLTLVKLLVAENRMEHIRSRGVEIGLLSIILLYLLLPRMVEGLLLSLNPLLTTDTLTRLYLVITQFFVMVAFTPTLLRYSKKLMLGNIQPSMLILLSFAFLIGVGTILLLLPRATVGNSPSLLDALFTATSAVCVTGLIVVDTATFFTPVGHSILMILMQIGGLGIMTLTTFFAFMMGGGTRLKEYSTMQSLLGEESLGKIKRTILQIALVTFTIEGIGAFALYEFSEGMNFASQKERVLFSLFHAVSGYCNAGFASTTENLADVALRFNSGVLTTIMVLVVIGGLGYPVLLNLGTLLRIRSGTFIQRRLSVHTKLVLSTTTFLLVAGSIGFFLLEQDNTLRGLSFGRQLMASLFHSVSARTAGFNTVDIGALTAPTLFFVMVLMWIGASPGSTGGGVKTTTIALALLNILAIASGRNTVEVFKRRVSDISIVKAFSTVLLSFSFIALAFFCLLLSERAPFEALLFEVVSAASTVGFSTGLTPQLSGTGKFIIILCMFVGRVGFLATIVALVRHRFEGRYDYTRENVFVT